MSRNQEWISGYLARLGVDHPGKPSVASLFELHRAHVERVPFENIDIQLGRPQGIDPAESVGRIIGGRGGYCFNLNGAFATLLAALGYMVSWHRGAVHGPGDPLPDEYGNHLALTVELDGSTWMPDVGLGNAHYEPIRLVAGMHRQGPFTFGLERSGRISDGWRFVHDPQLGSFYGMDFTMASAAWRDFRDSHARLSTSPDSSFVRISTICRRDARGADYMIGCRLRRDAGGVPGVSGLSRSERELGTAAEWFEAAADVFGLRLEQLTGEDRAVLWARIRAAHEALLSRESQPG